MEVIEKKAANFLVARENGVDTNNSNWIGGSVTLTPAQLLIGPNGASALFGGKSSARCIELHDIERIEHEVGFGTDVLSIYAADSVHKLRCYAAKGFKAQIELAMERAARRHRDPVADAASVAPSASGGEHSPDSDSMQSPPYPLPPVTPAAAPTSEVAKSLVACSSCAKEIALSASTCPSCGARNTYVHPKIAAFEEIDFDVPDFDYKKTGVTVVGATEPTHKKYIKIGVGVAFVCGVFLPFTPLAGLSVLGVLIGMGLFAYGIYLSSQNTSESFKVDFSTGQAVWKSTDDHLWAPVKKHFMGL